MYFACQSTKAASHAPARSLPNPMASFVLCSGGTPAYGLLSRTPLSGATSLTANLAGQFGLCWISKVRDSSQVC